MEGVMSETHGAVADSAGRYRPSQRWLHWIIAVLVLGNLAGGLTIDAMGFAGLRDTFGLATTNAIYTGHKTSGILVLVLMLVRLGLRGRFGAPSFAPSMSTPVRRLAAATHVALYVLVIAMPIIGWAATAAGGFPVTFVVWNLPGLVPKNESLSETLFALHGAVGVIILVLLAMHIAGALRHRYVLRDGVFRRIAVP
jgi:cytochrome b561